MSVPIIGAVTCSSRGEAGTDTPDARLQHLEVPKTTCLLPSAASSRFHKSAERLTELREP